MMENALWKIENLSEYTQTGEGVNTSGKGLLPADVVERRLHDGYFEGGSGLFVETCSPAVSEGGEM